AAFVTGAQSPNTSVLVLATGVQLQITSVLALATTDQPLNTGVPALATGVPPLTTSGRSKKHQWPEPRTRSEPRENRCAEPENQRPFSARSYAPQAHRPRQLVHCVRRMSRRRSHPFRLINYPRWTRPPTSSSRP